MNNRVTKSCRKAFRKATSLAAVLAMPLMFSSAALADDKAVASVASMPSVVASASLAAGPVTFGAPWVLLGLGALPVLWWLMRTVPPKPKSVNFPAMSLLWALQSEDQEPAQMPLWQRVLRLTAVTALILGMAQPEINNDTVLDGEGPVLLVVDNGWASADNWANRITEMDTVLDQAESDGRPVMILTTAPPENGSDIMLSNPLDVEQARDFVQEIKPHPWAVNRVAAADAVDSFNETNDAGAGSVVWLSNGLDSDGAISLAEELDEFGQVKVISDTAKNVPYLLVPPSDSGDDFVVTVKRPSGGFEDTLTLTATDEAGKGLGKAEVVFSKDDASAEARFDLSLDVRNQLTKVVIDGESSAGAVCLFDERWRRRPVGLIESKRSGSTQSLLREGNYVEKALEPYVDLRQGQVDELLGDPLSVMVMTDSAITDEATREKINDWVKEGGTLLRFAGPNLAVEGDDNDILLPVDLLDGARNLGGQLTSAQPESSEGLGLAPFERDSPFYGISVRDDVKVNKEILAAPGIALEEQTWAALEDGTPLVTAQNRGEGWIVFVHTTADPSWSDLPISPGLFVDMMRAVVTHSQGLSGDKGAISQSLDPLKIMDGSGQLNMPSAYVEAITKEIVAAGIVQPQNPPGFYGNDNMRHAHNLSSTVKTFAPLGDLPAGFKKGVYDAGKNDNDLAGPLLAGALSLLLVDILVLLGQQGHLPSAKRKKRKDNKGISPA